MKNYILVVLSTLTITVATGQLNAQTVPPEAPKKHKPEEVLAYQGDAVLTHDMMEGAFSRIPEDLRLIFVRDGEKVDQLVRSLLQSEVVAMDAEKSGFAQRPEVQERMLLSARNELAEAWLENLVINAPEADYEAMAYENYLLNPDQFTTPEKISVTHILIGVEEHTYDEAEEIALDLKSQLDEDPSRFEVLVAEFSEDPGKVNNSGSYIKQSRGTLVQPFEEAAFAMQAEGEITGPVKTEYGYHIIRLDKKYEPELKEFEEVKIRAMQAEKAQYQNQYRRRYMQKLLQSPVQFPPGSVEYMAKQYFGENLEKAPVFNEEGVQMMQDQSAEPVIETDSNDQKQ